MAHVHVRTNDTTKKRVQKILKALGLDVSTAVNLYFERIIIEEGIPFQICTHPICSGKKRVPDHIMEEWQKDAEESFAEALKTGKFYSSAEELHNDILANKYGA